MTINEKAKLNLLGIRFLKKYSRSVYHEYPKFDNVKNFIKLYDPQKHYILSILYHGWRTNIIIPGKTVRYRDNKDPVIFTLQELTELKINFTIVWNE